jgi:hypothetical protein
MGERWGATFGLCALAVLLLLSASLVSAHKFPVIEYSYVGHLWEASYTTMPRVPVSGDLITIQSHVEHPNYGAIEGNVTIKYGVYQDDTVWHWANGESYRDPSYQLVHNAWGTPTGKRANEFSTSLVIDRVGSYMVLVDYYEDGQYIGQSMHTMDVEQPYVGPLFLVASGIIVAAVLIGVKRGVL